MPDIPRRPSLRDSRYPWLWGPTFGLIVGASVLIVSSVQYGFRSSNVLLAIVIFAGFGLLGMIGELVRRYTPGGPAG